MSIMSDKWIRRQCTAPDSFAEYVLDGVTYKRTPLVVQDNHLVDREEGRVHVTRGAEGYPLTGPDCILNATPEEQAAFKPMIEPFESRQVRQRAVRMTADEGYLEKMISYGTSSYGYDLRVSNKFKIFTNINSTIVDPKNFDDKSFVDFEGDCCIIPPNSFALASSVEYFRIPRNIMTVCLGKSTYARCGIIVNVTPFEPEWEGHVTLEFSNTTPLPAKIYANEGVAQVLFLRSDEVCETSYADRQGKYMNQSATPVLPRA